LLGGGDSIVTKWKTNYKFDGMRLGKGEHIQRHGISNNDLGANSMKQSQTRDPRDPKS